MVEAVITLLIYAVVLALLVYLVIWVLDIIGLAVPQKVIQLLWVVVVLILILVALRLLLPPMGIKLL